MAALVALCASFLSAYVRARGASLSYSVEESHITRGMRYALVCAGLAFGWLTLDAVGRRLRCPRWPSCVRTSQVAPGGARMSGASEETPEADGDLPRLPGWSRGWAGRSPKHVGRRLFRLGGLLAHDLMPGVRRTVALNQAQVLGRPPADPLVAGLHP